MIVVTGGAGFIGSVLVKMLNEKGRDDIIIVDRLRESKKWKNLRSLNYAEYILADDFFPDEMMERYNRLDVIFHMGACSSTTEKNMDYLMENNVNYSKGLFNFSIENSIPFIYASSAATYGAGEFGYSDQHDIINNLLPLNPYGYSKQLFDQWVLEQKASPPKWYGVKFFNVFGPNEYHKEDMRSVVHKSYCQIKDTNKVKLFKSHRNDFKDGEQLRDFIYVKDAARALIEMWEKGDSTLSGIYNMGTGEARSFKDLVTAVFKGTDKPVEIEYFDMPLEIRDQYQYFTKAKMDKFKQLVPDFSFMSLEEAIFDYVNNYLLKLNPYL